MQEKMEDKYLCEYYLINNWMKTCEVHCCLEDDALRNQFIAHLKERLAHKKSARTGSAGSKFHMFELGISHYDG